MDKYIIDGNLGLDTFAERIVVRHKNTNKTYLLSKMELMDMATATVAYHEYAPLLKLSYENIVSFIDMFTSFDHKISATYINLVTDYYPMGNLDVYLQNLRKDRIGIDNQLVDKWFAQILDGLLYLWKQNFVHRNLKPDSIYLHDEQNPSLILGDNVPSSVAYDIRMRTRLPRRALSYAAPELFENDECTIQSNIYSFGCILLDLISCDMLTDEETLQLRICARHDTNTLFEILEKLKKIHKSIPELIDQMVQQNPKKRLTIKDLERNEYIIESMHDIDSNQMKYPIAYDRHRTHNDLEKNQKVEYYIKYLKQYRNIESRVEYIMQLLNQSKSVDLLILKNYFQSDLIPVLEHFTLNSNIVQNSLDILSRIIHNDNMITSQTVTFVTKMIPIFENDENLIGTIANILIVIGTQNATLLNKARINANLIQVMNKHEDNADICSKCCSLIWLMATGVITKDLRANHVPFFKVLFKTLEKHPNNSDLYTKACFAFLPFIYEKLTIEYLVQYNLVRCFTIGLQEHLNDVHAIKAGLAVLSELFKIDERCVMRFLCSRSNDGSLMDSIENLNKIFKQYQNRSDIGRATIILLKSMSSYDTAIDEMISTNVEKTILYDIKRFHSDKQDIARNCEDIMIRIRQRS